MKLFYLIHFKLQSTLQINFFTSTILGSEHAKWKYYDVLTALNQLRESMLKIRKPILLSRHSVDVESKPREVTCLQRTM